VPPRQRLLEFEAVGVRIAGQLAELRRDGRERPRRRAERVLVGRQLDDVTEAVLALKLGNGLARLVGLQAANARRRQVEEWVGS
jgi:hypothetical protein